MADQLSLDLRIDKLLEQTKTISKTPAESVPKKIEKPAEPQVLTVSELNRAIKGLLEKTYTTVWVKGEISNYKVPSSGHLYFTLKDATGQIRSVMFKGFAQALKFRPEDGMEVLVRCRVTVYEPRGDYQLFCEQMEPVGFGALQVAFEKLKEQLQKEGLFEQARKKQIPAFPARIAIVTSPTGAAIRDMLNVLGRRFGGGVEITLLPTAVQGDKAPQEIANAIKIVDKLGVGRFDVCIVGRGGGSLEDLWAFNTEVVARAVAQCRVPTISAVGHEVDFTICDFVADLRAPTPSAAAELVVKNKADLQERLKLLNRQLVQCIRKKYLLSKSHFEGLSKRLIDPKRRLQDLMLRCDELSERLALGMHRYMGDLKTETRFLSEKLVFPIKQFLQKRVQHFTSLTALLNGLSPLAILERGYSIVKKDKQIIKQTKQLKPGDKIAVRLSDGELSAEIL